MTRVKELTPRGTNQTIEQTAEDINKWYMGWAAYFAMTQYPWQLAAIEAHIRRRLRARIVAQQKKRRHLFAKLIKRGVDRRCAAKTVFSNKKRWALSHSRVVEQAFPNSWFAKVVGLKIYSDKDLSHWFDIKTRIQLA